MSADAKHRGTSKSTALEQHLRDVRSYARNWALTREDVEDIAQEVHLTLLTSNDPLAFLSPRSFVRRVAHNRVVDLLRRRTRERKYVTTDSEVAEALMEQPGDVFPEDMAERLHLDQRAEQVVARLQELAPVHAAVLVLFEACDYSHKEIARELGISPNTVAKYLTEVRVMIRSMVWKR
jgi:RNA polymerase sigma factor (sigma-70 family)